MRSNPKTWLSYGIGILWVVLLLGDGWVVHQALVQTRGTKFDFALVWIGAREWWQQRSPYRSEVTREIQEYILGHPAQPGENEYRFVYPAFVALVIFPLPLLPFELAVTIWLVLIQVFLFVSVGLLLHVLKWRPRALPFAFIVISILALRYFWLNVLLAQTTAFVLLLLTVTIWLAHHRKYEWSGIVLALTLFKPQLAILPMVFWIATIFFSRRWRALAAFCGMTLLLLVTPMLFVPNWLAEFLAQIQFYGIYNQPSATWTLVVANFVGAPVSTLLLALGAGAAGLFLVWSARQNETLAFGFAWAVTLTLLLVPLAWSYDFLVMLLPWLVCLNTLRPTARSGARIAVVLLAALPWCVSMIALGMSAQDAELLDKWVVPPALLLAMGYCMFNALRITQDKKMFNELR